MKSYRDILARSERQRPDGSGVWPLTNRDLPSRMMSEEQIKERRYVR